MKVETAASNIYRLGVDWKGEGEIHRVPADETFSKKSTMNEAFVDLTEARAIISLPGRVSDLSRWIQLGLATQSPPWLQIITPALLAASSRKRS